MRDSETEQERAARLQRMSANQHHRLASENGEARLQQMSANQRHRLVSETEEYRAGRLQQMSANQHHRLAAEIGSEREANVEMQYCLSIGTELLNTVSNMPLSVSLAHSPSLASQTQPTPAQIAFSITILKAIRAGVGWVWLARLYITAPEGGFH